MYSGYELVVFVILRNVLSARSGVIKSGAGLTVFWLRWLLFE